MAQHPQFRKVPEESVEELLTIMDLLVQYGFCHEDVMYPIVESALNVIYADAASLWAEASGEGLDDGNGSLFNASVGQLWEYIDADTGVQFARDLRNAISVALGEYTDDPAGAVLRLR